MLLKSKYQHIAKEFEKEIDGWSLKFRLYEPKNFLDAILTTKASPSAKKTLTIPAVVNGYWVEEAIGPSSIDADAPEKSYFQREYAI